MRIRAGCQITYDCPQPTPMLLMISPHPSRLPDLLGPHALRFDPPVPSRDYLDGFGNTCTRIVAPAGRLAIHTRFEVQDSGATDPVHRAARQHPVEALPDEALVYLLGSRYCDTDKLADFAWARFGQGPTGWDRVQAICDFAHNHITFDYMQASATRSAADAHREKVGVCRDFAHLAVTLCRCVNIPARYCTGYLGDIGMPPPYGPMDFAAWFEVYLDGAWHTFDARNNTPRIGRILMARGRDATDVAIATTFGPCTLAGFEVVTDEITG
ncbi:transglutaminase-like domain-containing protein [Falsiroseomonas selenitidurans]|uniref:Transglutaminase family protein n=1 Tax=Falsiroseomonas selenitidurans TaxID=2716335 RepID=A0ABX1EBP0_9PROT|nr:transglutaminase family protein [Falsiroseomonas selenitidurans]NKC33173.1 transglutaminase family protein [Falsiroseomonas selenitidurans]